MLNADQTNLKNRLVELMRAGAWLPHHDCAACGAWLHYLMQEGQLYFDSNCDCGKRASIPQPRALDDLDDMITQAQWEKVLQGWVNDQERHYAAV